MNRRTEVILFPVHLTTLNPVTTRDELLTSLQTYWYKMYVSGNERKSDW